MREMDILIGQKVIGSTSQVFVIAEIGINHDGSVSQAERLIDAAQNRADAEIPELSGNVVDSFRERYARLKAPNRRIRCCA
jgi:sialic acid synthase SpsE